MKTKTLTFTIKCCNDCPHLYYEEYDDVGTSFGLDYYCELDRSICKDKLTAQKEIDKDCPLP